MAKALNEMMFPVENYTDRIHTGVRATIMNSPLSFTVDQLVPHLQRGYPWLQSLDENQMTLLRKLIRTGLTKLVQLGLIKQVTSKVSVDQQWQATSKVSESGYTNITSEDSVAQTDEAKKAINRRALGGLSLWKLNGQGKFGQLH